MELIQGEGLDAVLRAGAVGLPDAARWGAQICDALADAHDAGIMHRDIKPSNILITRSGTAKVLDFGIARAADPCATGDRLTQTGFIVGTPPYMAPEQARGFPEPHSDLYALGCLLFELITGRLPFQAPDTLGYLTAHLTQEPPAPGSVAPGIPSAWDDLVLRLLHKDPSQRYPDAAGLSRALRQLGGLQRPEPPASPESSAPPEPPAAPNTSATPESSTAAASRAPLPAPAQDADGKGPVPAPTPPVKTAVRTPRATPHAPFDASWTGQEPPPTYAAGPHTTALWVTCVLLLVTAAASLYFPLHLGLVTPGATQGQEGWLFVVSVGGGLGGVLGLLSGGCAVQRMVSISKHATAPWALRVDPDGITTSGAAGRREIPWDQIQRVSIEVIQGSSPYRYTGLHIDPEKGAAVPARLRPAGWPLAQPESVTARRRVPVCVLGPMTEEQRADLMAALAGHAGKRWTPEVHFTALPASP